MLFNDIQCIFWLEAKGQWKTASPGVEAPAGRELGGSPTVQSCDHSNGHQAEWRSAVRSLCCLLCQFPHFCDKVSCILMPSQVSW